MFPLNFPISQRDFDQLGEFTLFGILAVRHLAVDIDNRGISQAGREEMFLLTFNRGAEPLQLCSRQHFARGECVIKQRDGFIERHGKDEGLVFTLTGWLT